MADVLFILIVVAFFGVMALLVHACDRIIGPDELAITPESVPATSDPVDPSESEPVAS